MISKYYSVLQSITVKGLNKRKSQTQPKGPENWQVYLKHSQMVIGFIIEHSLNWT